MDKNTMSNKELTFSTDEYEIVKSKDSLSFSIVPRKPNLESEAVQFLLKNYKKEVKNLINKFETLFNRELNIKLDVPATFQVLVDVSNIDFILKNNVEADIQIELDYGSIDNKRVDKIVRRSDKYIKFVSELETLKNKIVTTVQAMLAKDKDTTYNFTEKEIDSLIWELYNQEL